MNVKLVKQGNRIIVHGVSRLDGIPGAYHSTHGYWTVPLCLESYALLRQQFTVSSNTELRRWVATARQLRHSTAKLGTLRDTELQVVPRRAPKLAKAMASRTYQRVGARFIADTGACLIADDPGLGKTLIAIGGVIESETPGPYLVVAPRTAADSVWNRELRRWIPKHDVTILPRFRYQREKVMDEFSATAGRRDWLIIHPEVLATRKYLVCAECGESTQVTSRTTLLVCGHQKSRHTTTEYHYAYPQLYDINFGAVIIDESHELLIRRNGMPTQRRLGLELLSLRENALRIALSGTPCDSKPHQLWGTLNWLDPKQYSAFYRWAELYWQRGGYTGYELGQFRKERERMLWRSLGGIALRRTKSEVASDLPPKIEVGTRLDPGDRESPTGIWLPLTDKQQRAYDDIERYGSTQLRRGRLDAIGALSVLTRLKQLASAYGRVTDVDKYVPSMPSNKFEWLIAALEEWGYPTSPIDKVVVVSQYTSILEVFRRGIEKHFKTRAGRPLCAAITGRVPVDDRRGILRRFNDTGNEHVMFLNVKAGGTAITIDSASRMVFISETRSPDQQGQAEDRIHRVSNPRTCMYYYLRSLGTCDETIARLNTVSDAETRRLLDQRRGVEYLRTVLELDI